MGRLRYQGLIEECRKRSAGHIQIQRERALDMKKQIRTRLNCVNDSALTQNYNDETTSRIDPASVQGPVEISEPVYQRPTERFQ